MRNNNKLVELGVIVGVILFAKSFQRRVLHFDILSTLNNCMSIRLLWCNTLESITPVLHQIARKSVILSRVLHRI